MLRKTYLAVAGVLSLGGWGLAGGAIDQYIGLNLSVGYRMGL